MNEMTRYLILLVLVTGGITFLLRAFPFIAFGRGQQQPEIVRYIGRTVSPAAIAMLVVYCFCVYFKARPFSSAYGWNLPEIAAGALVIGLHLWKRNALLSIIAGVVLYMLLIQQIFPAG